MLLEILNTEKSVKQTISALWPLCRGVATCHSPTGASSLLELTAIHTYFCGAQDPLFPISIDQLTTGVEKNGMAGLWRAARIYRNTKNDAGKRQTVEGSQCTRFLSNSNYGTRTGQVRHYHNCSCRHLLWHKEQRYVIKTSNQNLIPGLLRKFQKIVKEGPSIYSRGSHKIRQEPPMRIPELW